MKVLAGSLKGRNILVPKHTRAVSLLVKKACFDILGEEIINSKVLDLFCGSGSLGMEAFSRGAKEVVFVDIRQLAMVTLKHNLNLFKIAPFCRCYQKDAFKAIKDFFRSKETFDFIFVDPPYHKETLTKVLQALAVYDILNPFGYVVGFCSPKEKRLNLRYFSLVRERRYGQTALLIYKKDAEKEGSPLPGNL